VRSWCHPRRWPPTARPARRGREREPDTALEGRARLRRPAAGAVVDGAGRPRRGRALPGRVPVRVRRAAAARARWRMLLAADLGDAFTAGHRTARLRAGRVQQTMKDLETIPVRRTAGSPTGPAAALQLALPHRLPAARLQDRGGPEVPGGGGHAPTRLRVPRTRARGAAADERRLVAGVHRVAGVRGQGAGGRRPQPGFEPHAPLRLSRPHAGVRARAPARRAPGEGARTPRGLRAGASTSCGGAS
jgi:hypothetical protein